MKLSIKEIIVFVAIVVFIIIAFIKVSNQSSVVKRVIDGDTIILTNNERIRFERIDAPELETECGQLAKQELKILIENKKILITRTGTDRYGRTLATIKTFNDKIDIETWLVSNNLAEWYMGHPANPNICQTETYY